MDQDRIIFCLVDIQNRCLHAVIYADSLQCFIYRLFCLTRNNGNCISHKTYMTVKDQSVIRTHLRCSLAGKGKTFLRHIFIGKDTCNSGYLLGSTCFNIFHPGVSVGTSQYLHDQAVPWCQIICIDRLSGYQ